ncbi:hypothetical protein A2673_03115 [Candidatus Kaiserbacteria bacterium RIFCSPHIGHO2_01_FULL_50_13]|uniref:Uncharacterized protein n=1 Tax=Candidatus Kaiserbacteria bacterium RIFCSPLOWO2_01_FULL_50_24 TaxID=1798507 RepID=A0A1F6EI65_9BACT|nr:MAG: hypothetical protein A2673_03115 [Candidatus Kaiserbacteria bacterium RIFCSPHIGHO2_01_FULL_50_13]OGG73307.1 MAG: hypothetical protein A3A34_03445 [Candidatus Kaiserbacteria bacterium RIFCSPLOWO2_01_FULL_50_24]OGG82319.1 MAG: hypothetical protein A3H74_02335 [Candidatus Kaiserbacteria bacterium RIFCSPLOWO2_02_FULL_51_13]
MSFALKNFWLPLTIATLFIFMPLTASAQVEDLRAAMYEVLARNQSTATLSSAELEALVSALVVEAEAQGVTAAGLTAFSPEDIEGLTFLASTEETCTYPAFVCATNEAFGFSGDDTRFPIALGAAAGALVIILGLVLTRRYHNDAFIGMR